VLCLLIFSRPLASVASECLSDYVKPIFRNIASMANSTIVIQLIHDISLRVIVVECFARILRCLMRWRTTASKTRRQRPTLCPVAMSRQCHPGTSLTSQSVHVKIQPWRRQRRQFHLQHLRDDLIHWISSSTKVFHNLSPPTAYLLAPLKIAQDLPICTIILDQSTAAYWLCKAPLW